MASEKFAQFRSKLYFYMQKGIKTMWSSIMYICLVWIFFSLLGWISSHIQQPFFAFNAWCCVPYHADDYINLAWSFENLDSKNLASKNLASGLKHWFAQANQHPVINASLMIWLIMAPLLLLAASIRLPVISKTQLKKRLKQHKRKPNHKMKNNLTDKVSKNTFWYSFVVITMIVGVVVMSHLGSYKLITQDQIKVKNFFFSEKTYNLKQLKKAYFVKRTNKCGYYVFAFNDGRSIETYSLTQKAYQYLQQNHHVIEEEYKDVCKARF